MSSVTAEPSTTRRDEHGVQIVAAPVEANAIKGGMHLTNLGVVVGVTRNGVFVTATVRGTIWNLGTGMGDIAQVDITWHETNEVAVDAV